MITHNLGYPRIGAGRELKKASESFWDGKISSEELVSAGRKIRESNWKAQAEAGIDLIPANDFSFYDHVLDMSVAVGAVPGRFRCLQNFLRNEEMEFYFALARGYQKEGFDITAMEMTKWFDTNYHYIVPEFIEKQRFELSSTKFVDEFAEAKSMGINAKPVIIGPVSFLLLGKARENEFDRLDLLPDLLPVYLDLIYELAAKGARWIQFDEPFLVMDLSEKAREMFRIAYNEIKTEFPRLNILIATYFDGLKDNLSTALELRIDALHIDLVRAPEQLKPVLESFPEEKILSLGLVDGRNIWKDDYVNSLFLIQAAAEKLGPDRIMIAPSCSLIHTPLDLEMETDEKNLPSEIKQWMAFSKQKIDEVATLRELALLKLNVPSEDTRLSRNQDAMTERKSSPLIHNVKARERMTDVSKIEMLSRSRFDVRKRKQKDLLKLPLFPTTTIG
ncbi:MAG: 5-methyltetrahydropteroyltriglutamate--homocysteine S-methyltransferase, partial [Chloroflexota bacterium]